MKGMEGMRLNELSGKVLGSCFEVANELGVGFLESVYEKALLYALKEKELNAESQVPVKVGFRGYDVGIFYADIMVENCLIIELKAVKALVPEHNAQVLNYLKATGIEAGLLVNFGTSKLEYRRFNNHMSQLPSDVKS